MWIINKFLLKRLHSLHIIEIGGNQRCQHEKQPENVLFCPIQDMCFEYE